MTTAAVWMPDFACPECGAAATADEGGRIVCAGCGRFYERRDDVWRFLTPLRANQLERFVRQYRVVRERDGDRPVEGDYYRRLPSVPAADPNANRWRIRRETYHHLLSHVLAAGPQPLRVLDLGAGSGWLSHRLATLGHRAVAVDAIDDEVDGLRAARHYSTPLVLVQADFNALPFVPGQFDLVVFNGSLHYSTDTAETLERASRMLAPGGALVVMDSPMFRADRDGTAMVREAVRRFTIECGLTDAVQQGIGYLTFAMLAAIAERLHLQPEFVPSRGPIAWRVRRHLARFRLRRSPAAFGLWVAR